jgi:hypothetical protein
MQKNGNVKEPLEYVISCGTQVHLTHDKNILLHKAIRIG